MSKPPNECCKEGRNLVEPETEDHESAGPWPHINDETGNEGYSLVAECRQCGERYTLYYEYTEAVAHSTEETVDVGRQRRKAHDDS